MPRTQSATTVLIASLIFLVLATLFNAWQNNSTEQQVIDLKTEMQALKVVQQEIRDQLKQGVVTTSAQGGGTGPMANAGGAWADPYASSLTDSDNILVAATDELIPEGVPTGGQLRVPMGSDPKGFNWLLENSVDVANIQALVHNGYTRRDFKKPDNFVPDLAHKVAVNDDYTKYTIHLRKGVYWHVPAHPNLSSEEMKWLREPRELTSEDCKFFFDLVKNPQVEAGAARNYFEDVDSVETPDKYTCVVNWKKKTYTSKVSTLEYAYPLPKWLFTKNEDGSDIPDSTLGLKFNNHWASPYPIGTGPYKFVEYVKGEKLILARNERFWGEKPPLDGFNRKILKDPEQSLLNLKADNLDFAGLTPTQYTAEILRDKNSPFNTGELEYMSYDFLGYSYIGWNADKPMFADKRVRTALTLAFNRQGIIENVYKGLGVLQTGPFFHKHTANDPSVEALPFDLDQAKKVLEEAGWKDTDGDGLRDKEINGERVAFKFVITSYAQSKEWAAALSVYKEDLRKIGVEMNTSPVDWPTMQKKMNEKKFDAFTGGWGLGWDIDPYQLWHSSQADIPKGSNRVGFRNARADEIIVTLRETFDDAKRLELLREFHRIIHDEQPYTFFRAPKGVVSWNPRLKNMQAQQIRPHLYPLPFYLKEGT